MYQIQFRLGLRPRPRWGAYSALPEPLAGLRGPILLREERGGTGAGEGESKWRGGDEISPLHHAP